MHEIQNKDATSGIGLVNTKKRLELLYPKFVRIHKSYLIAVDRIDSIERNRVTIGENILPIGESYRRQFFEVIDSKRLT